MDSFWIENLSRELVNHAYEVTGRNLLGLESFFVSVDCHLCTNRRLPAIATRDRGAQRWIDNKSVNAR